MEALRLIDFEYSNYGYRYNSQNLLNLTLTRGFEFGNHFCEWMYDYTNPEAPYYYYKPEHWPTYGKLTTYTKLNLSLNQRRNGEFHRRVP